MKALALVLVGLLALPASAEEVAAVQLEAGQAAPVKGVLLPDPLAVAKAQELVACKAEVQVLKAAPAPLHPAVVVALVVVGVLAGGAAGYGIAQATR